MHQRDSHSNEVLQLQILLDRKVIENTRKTPVVKKIINR